MENYEQKYNEALERAKYYHDRDNIQFLENIFPELRKSEDERIREELLDYLKRFIPHYDTDLVTKSKVWIAWLEKQGKQKPTDKVGLKFKIGDWIVQENIGVYKVHEICKSLYEVIDVEDNHYSISFDKEYMCHLWTIQDAKDGDVIFSNDGHGSDSIELIKSIYDECINFWFCLSSKNNFKDYYYEVYNGRIPCTNFASRKDATPATKEQRDLLFQKIKEAGYEWDAEKKELRKIEQKPTWSEEDKSHIGRILSYLESFKAYNAPHIEPIKKEIDWLKSLKPQNRWKPSEEEINALTEVAFINESAVGKERKKVLEELIEKLKTLRDYE